MLRFALYSWLVLLCLNSSETLASNEEKKLVEDESLIFPGKSFEKLVDVLKRRTSRNGNPWRRKNVLRKLQSSGRPTAKETKKVMNIYGSYTMLLCRRLY